MGVNQGAAIGFTGNVLQGLGGQGMGLLHVAVIQDDVPHVDALFLA